MAAQITSIPRIIDGVTPFSAGGINPIISTIAANIEALADQVDSMVVKDGLEYGGFSYYDKGFTADCEAGMLVALSDDGTYVPAVSELSDTLREDGTYVFSRKANIAGVLLTDVDDSGGGVILRHGIIKESNLINKLAPEMTPGDYYLTEAPKDEDAKAYVGVGKHRESPNSPTDIYCYTLLHSSTAGKTFILVDPDRAHYNTTSEIRKLQTSSDSQVLKIETVGGVATVKFEPVVDTVDTADIKDTADSTNAAKPGFALSGVTDAGFTRVPVVNKLMAGAGMSVSLADGTATLACTQNLNSLIDVSAINLDGAYLSTVATSGAVAYVFPQGVNSSLLGCARIPHSDAGFKSTYIVISVYGNAGNSVFSDLIVSAQPCIDYEAINPEAGDIENTTHYIASPATYTIGSLSSSDKNKVYTTYKKLTSPVPPNSLVSIRLSANPTSSIYLAAISIKLA